MCCLSRCSGSEKVFASGRDKRREATTDRDRFDASWTHQVRRTPSGLPTTQGQGIGLSLNIFDLAHALALASPMWVAFTLAGRLPAREHVEVKEQD